MRLLIANRGEIALRIIRTAREFGIETVSVYAEDDAGSPHVDAATESIPLKGSGAAAYLDQDSLLEIATNFGVTHIHPGYGFLSENADFAQACTDAGVVFVGPDAGVLRTFGDKASARATAVGSGIPVLPATAGGVSLDEVREFFARNPRGIMIKALAGGGGRGMRAVTDARSLGEAYRVCAAEALAGFGTEALFAEVLSERARHIEVQVVAAPGGGGTRALALGDRDCSVQRRHQKLIEIAPAQGLSDPLRERLHSAAARLCAAVGYRGIATVEFLLEERGFVFLEVNPRIQVEHTVTEEVTGVDLVAVQLMIADGMHFEDLDLPSGITWAEGDFEYHGELAKASGIAIQARVNMEIMTRDGSVLPASGTLDVFSPPSGPGVRVDTFGVPGLTPSIRYDSLLAKVITHARRPDFLAAVRKSIAALDDFAIDGVSTNISFLRAILSDKDFRESLIDVDWLGSRLVDLVPEVGSPSRVPSVDVGSDEVVVRAQMAGIVVELAAAGDGVHAGGQVAILEAMKMQHVLPAEGDLEVVRVLSSAGRSVSAGEPLLVVRSATAGAQLADIETVDLDAVRPDLAEIIARQEVTLDAARPTAVAKRHKLGRRTARENVYDLVDDNSLVEYGALALAAQRSRRSEEDLIANTPADGLIGGVATIGGGESVVISYDYSVLAGTQGLRNHAKTDRLLEIAGRKRVPVVLFAEGGGGRPGDTDAGAGSGLELGTFRAMAALSGRVPLVAVVAGRCFAGNAALAGACDVLIGTPDANIGMGGPAMVEGGGLGNFRPEDIGPVDVQRRNGVVHLVADDDAQAVALAKKYLGYFQGAAAEWTAPDLRLSRHVVPENRLRSYDVRAAITSIADVGSDLELRRDYGRGVVTALIRVEGVAYGVLANSSEHLGGAIDAEASDKASDFLELVEAHRIPLVTLCDTPGFMVGPDSEEEATVRRFGKFFVAGARLTVPFGTVILRKGYGLGAMAMAGGSFRAPEFTVAWPTGEIGPMGLEGAVRLGFRKELESIEDPAARETLFGQFVELAYAQGKALMAATTFELDDVIDPADTRRWIRQLSLAPQQGRKRLP
ncbi:carboxyl transferase domain-containing protein [Rhodococcus sp. IEGM 1379]|uniref:acetyl-CoA carboxylase family protein n=1 Tax=Rhodococcus sp. IEGM 1379 TaxID=3047086 RepID=UPI0024B862C7|nr:carboxyl transferase domain-containing protein [Rhodococcus sp. IEGM 1379]MDI9917202.1 carboxyl transferase domain-containing protein [Rhodococcus sp. IEGM 1379]